MVDVREDLNLCERGGARRLASEVADVGALDGHVSSRFLVPGSEHHALLRVIRKYMYFLYIFCAWDNFLKGVDDADATIWCAGGGGGGRQRFKRMP